MTVQGKRGACPAAEADGNGIQTVIDARAAAEISETTRILAEARRVIEHSKTVRAESARLIAAVAARRSRLAESIRSK